MQVVSSFRAPGGAGSWVSLSSESTLAAGSWATCTAQLMATLAKTRVTSSKAPPNVSKSWASGTRIVPAVSRDARRRSSLACTIAAIGSYGCSSLTATPFSHSSCCFACHESAAHSAQVLSEFDAPSRQFATHLDLHIGGG